MTTTRNDVKNAIQTLLAQIPSVRKVTTFRPKTMVQTDFPAVVVNLVKSKETRLTQSAPFGKKQIEFTAQLEVSMIDVSNDGSGQLAFDQVLDDIDTQLRTDPTLGGIALGSTIQFINTAITPPQIVAGQNMILIAVKQFDVTVQVIG